MSEFTPKRIDLSTINGGKRLENGSGYTPETFNAPIEASAFAQGLATNPPNVEKANQVGTPSVTIETLPDGTPRLVFENLKGEQGEQGEQGETGAIDNLPDNVMLTDTEQTVTAEKVFEDGTLKANNLKAKDGTDIVLDNSTTTTYGNKNRAVNIQGKGTRPTYNDTEELALLGDFGDKVKEKHIIVDQETGDNIGGYILWDSGILMQWGTTVGTGAAKTIVYSRYYKTANSYALLVTPHQKESGYVVEYNRFGDTKYFNGFIFSAKAETKVDWFTIGRWEGN